MKLFAELSDYNRSTRLYWCFIALVGSVCLAYAANGLFFLAQLSLVKLLILGLIVFLAGLYPIHIPGTQCVITPGDIFLFLTALLLGTPAAIVVAATDGLIASCRSSRRWTSRIGSLAMAAIAMAMAATLFERTLSYLKLFVAENTALFAALLLAALAHFMLSSLLLATHNALRHPQPLFTLWWNNYWWISLTSTASATVAGMIFLGLERFGIVALLATGPIVAIVFATSHFYFKQAEERANAHRQRAQAAEAQAALAEKHLQEMQESEERFHSAFDYAHIGMALVSIEGRWLQVNRSLCQILGAAEEELLATDFQSLTHDADLESVRRGIAQLLAGKWPAIQIEQRYVHKLGHEVWTLLSVSVLRETQTRSQCFIFQVQDITDRKRAEARLLHDAFHDSLTGLPNRALFLDRLQLALARVQRRPDKIVAVLFLDCDRFKIINDSLGHLAGDELLKIIARRLEASLRPVDTVARLGGDEFTILVEDIKNTDEVLQLVERIQNALSTPINLGGNEITITTSIGITFSNREGQKPEELLRDADTAMYQAKSFGKARHALFDPSMHTRAMTQLHLENDLRRAIEQEELFLVYQPIVALETARLLGFEALVRWRHPKRGVVSPVEFIPVAEETGLIIPIGQWVLEESCRQMNEWQKFAPTDIPLTINVNLSGRQIMQGNIAETVLTALKRSYLSAQHLKLEITESVVMENTEVTIRRLDQLRALGVRLGIDDFGTGYSSLSYLHRLPIDTLKIDRSFVVRMAENNENAEIVRTIVMLAKTLKMDITAEGVETQEQLQQLQQLNCEMGQGWLFSKPLEATAATQLVRQSPPWLAFALQPASLSESVPSNLLFDHYTM